MTLLKDFEGKLAIVTGASKSNGIGYATACLLASRGADIVLHYHSNQQRAEEGANRIRIAYHVRVVTVGADSASTDFGTKIVEKITMEYPGRKVNAVIHNASDARYVSGIHDWDFAQFDAIMHANVRGPLLLMKALDEADLITAPGGRIVLLGSLAARLGSPQMHVYAASKSALYAINRSWAEELGARGITCNIVQPGPVRTDYHSSDDHPLLLRVREMQFLKRSAATSELAEVIVWLASEGSSFVTGQVVAADGGVDHA